MLANKTRHERIIARMLNQMTELGHCYL